MIYNKRSRKNDWPILALAIAALLFLPGVTQGQKTGPDAAVDQHSDDQPAASVKPINPPSFRFDFVAGDAGQRIDQFIKQMTIEEKIGQLRQVYPNDGTELTDSLAGQVRNGEIGSLFYPGNRQIVEQAQRLAVEESRLGIPLLVARDVIHGLRTIMPIPLGQAATWNPLLVQRGAEIATMEARSESIDWTFAPMVDISRDARWGRIAETLGEDPHLAGELAAAMVRGFQQERGGKIYGMLACAKHFVAYGFSEGGRDYNRASLSPSDLHNVALPPFKRTKEAGCRTLMTSFSSINGVPGTGHDALVRGVLKNDWQFSGFVVSDWSSITEMVVHGYATNHQQAAEKAILAGVDMDMCSPAYHKHLATLCQQGRVSVARLDDAVRRVLRAKVELARSQHQPVDQLLAPKSLEVAREITRQSIVLLKNDKVLPLDAAELKQVAIVGPMADAAKQQLGCWSLDGKAEDSITPLADLRQRLQGVAEVRYAAGAKNTFDLDASLIPQAIEAVKGADVALVFVGEDAVLSGEARSRTTLDLPGVQSQLIKQVAETGIPTVVVLLAGRPLTIAAEVDAADGVMFAWHPGTMAGPAISELLFGNFAPSGKLPVTFPRSVGQTPIYYNHTNTGRPSPANYRPLIGSEADDLPAKFQYKSHYLDEQLGPLFPFGFGLSYTTFEYSDTSTSSEQLRVGEEQEFKISATVTNTGDVPADEIVQLYVRDVVASSLRPVRELKDFRRIRLSPGEVKQVAFRLRPQDLGYLDSKGRLVIESGRFQAAIGGDSTVAMSASFRLLPSNEQELTGQHQPLPTATTPESLSR